MDLIAATANTNITLRLFMTGTGQTGRIEHGRLPNRTFARRISKEDLLLALDGYDRDVSNVASGRTGTVCFVCGPPNMTDDFVAFLACQPGMAEDRVLCEKWW